MNNTILQVEDDPNDVFFLHHAMKSAGVTNPIQIASDGQQAINYMQGVGKYADREKYPLPSLVLLDLKLPQVMGLDVLKSIKAQYGGQQVVVVLTSSANRSDIETAYRLGANGYLVKPCQTTKFKDIARAIKEFWLTSNTPPPEPTEEAGSFSLPQDDSQRRQTLSIPRQEICSDLVSF